VHFSYVVLLRALRKGGSFLQNYAFFTGNTTDDLRTKTVMNRLVESSILDDCAEVFDAFDEKLMFADDADNARLKKNFKNVFHNVSDVMDCVQCQQCKLHSKVSLLGYGTSLKLLFLPEEMYESSLSKNEIVAFINVLHTMSESIVNIKTLTALYWENHDKLLQPIMLPDGVSLNSDDLMDKCVGAVRKCEESKFIDEEREVQLVTLCLQRDPNLMALVKHYGNDLEKFSQLTLSLADSSGNGDDDGLPDAIVVGTGLAGLAATLQILDRGGRVTLLEKESRIGGNSAKASSGINSWNPDPEHGDSVSLFKNDTMRSAGASRQEHLIDVLVEGSGSAVAWLKERGGVDLSQVAQLGGHSAKRTNRPYNGMAGAEIIYAMQKAVKEYEKSGALTILMNTRVTNLQKDDEGRVVGVEINDSETLFATSTILATGGFASDRTSGSYLEVHRPDLMSMPATAGDFSTGDGISLATKAVGAGVVDMDKVQLHPTGWIDPLDEGGTTKTLAAELMRGVGGVLLNAAGERFCNEVGTRAYVTDSMLKHDDEYNRTGVWNIERQVPTFYMALSEEARSLGTKHVDHYVHKGLMQKVEGLGGVAKVMGVDENALKKIYERYREESTAGVDSFGKKIFNGMAGDLEGSFYVGRVTPVLHYCMGGITIDEDGKVLEEGGGVVQGLWAAGEVAGGVHGENR